MVRQQGPIYVINLARSIDRRAAMLERLTSAGLSFEFIAARDERAMAAGDPDLEASRRAHPGLNRPLTRGEVACAQSHLDVLARIRDGSAAFGIVLEDDVELAADAPEVLGALTGRLESLGDLVLLGHHSARRPPALGAFTCFGGPAVAGRRVSRVAEFAMGAYGYVVTRRGAARLTAHARPLRMPWDWVTGYAPAAGVRLFAVSPPCVTPYPDGGVTTIDGRDGGYLEQAREARWPAVRARLGAAALFMRRLGIATDSYVEHF